MKNKKLFIICFFVLLFFSLIFTCFTIHLKNDVSVSAKMQSRHIVIIDAGHGGIDGGAVGCNGAIEKDINLQIAIKLKTLLKANGYDVIMTREKDEMINGSKVADMRARLDIIKNNPNAIFLSIHQNLFSHNSSWGAQVFYSPNNSDSKVLAELLQARFVELLQPNNKRLCKPTDPSLYLFKNAVSPAILIECGFLSNALDANNLLTDEYQNKVSFVIFSAICDYYSYKLNS